MQLSSFGVRCGCTFHFYCHNVIFSYHTIYELEIGEDIWLHFQSFILLTLVDPPFRPLFYTAEVHRLSTSATSKSRNT